MRSNLGKSSKFSNRSISNGLGNVFGVVYDGKNPETANIYTAINNAEIQNIIELEAVMLLQNLVLIKPVNYEKL